MSLSTSIQHVNKKIFSASEQQLALARLGQLAQSDLPAEQFLEQAMTSIADMVGADYVAVWELDAHQKALTLRAGIDGNRSIPSLCVPLQPNSLETLTLASSYPILSEDLQAETRFPSSHLLSQDLRSGISLLVGIVEKPRGVLQVFTTQSQVFEKEDSLALQCVANILAFAMSQKLTTAPEAKQALPSHPVTHSNTFAADSYEIKNRLSESRERERIRLAQELHDAPIQDLYGLIYQVDDLRDYIQDPEGEQILDEHTQMLNRIVNTVRTICRELRPPSLSPFGLEVAIRDHVEKLREQHPDIHIQLQLMRDQQVLSDSLRLNLFRIYQQAMSNVLRHAEATDVHVRFSWDDDTILLEVEDNGKGFELPTSWVELVRKDQFGLVGLAERVEGIRGKLEVNSAPGAGTLVRAIVPRPQ